jgi:hypothetical protein
MPNQVGVLRFNLEDPETEREFHKATKATEAFLCLWEIDQWLRGKLKYGQDYKNADEALQAARDELSDIMTGRKISIDDCT